MKLGVDLSIQDELASFSPRYSYQGKEVEPFSFFASHSGMSFVRLRLWHNPYDEEGNPYGGGSNDLPCFLRLAKKANVAGMKVLLDFHFSDFWVDPSRQTAPKAWRGLDFEGTLKALECYVEETLQTLVNEGIDLVAIQTGNEITNGFIFPHGRIWEDCENSGGFAGFSRLFSAAYRLCKNYYPSAKVICHLEHSGDFAMQDHFFSHLQELGTSYDVIGESYYPYWHGNLAQFEDNISRLKAKFGKEIWVVEAGYEYAKSHVPGHQSDFDTSLPEFVPGNLDGRVPFPLTQKGQADYFRYFLSLCHRIGVDAVTYWEPAWIERPGQGWAMPAGQRYCGLEPSVAYNDWGNETLFDFDGNATEAIDVFTQAFVDAL